MHVIAVYDIGHKRVGKVLKIFRKYLTWIQNSVFQGEITLSKYEKLKNELAKIIEPGYDSILFFRFRSDFQFKKEFVGKEFNPFDTMI